LTYIRTKNSVYTALHILSIAFSSPFTASHRLTPLYTAPHRFTPLYTASMNPHKHP
jgi:hypothetical protein